MMLSLAHMLHEAAASRGLLPSPLLCRLADCYRRGDQPDSADLAPLAELVYLEPQPEPQPAKAKAKAKAKAAKVTA